MSLLQDNHMPQPLDVDPPPLLLSTSRTKIASRKRVVWSPASPFFSSFNGLCMLPHLFFILLAYVGDLEFQCKTSEVTAMDMPAYIEGVSAGGVNRRSVGISSDTLLFHIAAITAPTSLISTETWLWQKAAGVSLSELCNSQTSSSRRSVIQLQSLRAAGSGPGSSTTLSSVDCASAPL